MPITDQEKRRKYAREWIAARRAAFFNGKSCINCGSLERLELDHIDPKTKVDNHIWSWSKKRQDVEIAKCQVLCRFCHQEKTREDFKQGSKYMKHGKVNTYRKYSCRCVLCVNEFRRTKHLYNTKGHYF